MSGSRSIVVFETNGCFLVRCVRDMDIESLGIPSRQLRERTNEHLVTRRRQNDMNRDQISYRERHLDTQYSMHINYVVRTA
jgi:hypothetical protein